MIESCGLPTEVLTAIKNVILKYQSITQAKLFGSRAKGNFKRYSDIDIAVFGDVNIDTIMSLKDDLEELDVIYRFDVVHYETLKNKQLQEHIDRVGIQLI